MKRLELAKKIVVTNWRLVFVYRCMLSFMALLLVAHFFSRQKWSKEIPMSQWMRAAIWAPPVANTTYLQDEYKKVASVPGNLCDRPHMYDYRWSNTGEWTYFNHSCMNACGPARAGLDCLSGAQIIRPNTNELFFATEVETTYASSNDPSGSFLSQRYFIPLENAYRFEMMYAFHVPKEAVKSAGNLWAAQAFSGGWGTNAYTVIVDVDDHPRRSFPPANTVGLSVAELFHFAGRPQMLDEEQPSLGANTLPGARYPNGPVGRLTGVEINIELKCYSPAAVPSKYSIDGWSGIVCAAKVRPASPNWVAQQHIDSVSGKIRYHWFHGILVRVKFTGSVHYFDFIALLEFVTTAIILLGLPSAAMRFFVMYCLGHLSEVYYGVLNQEFDLPQHVASSAANLMSNSVSYNLIAREEDRGISMPEMFKIISCSLSEFEELNSKELKAFTLFCYAVSCDIRGNHFSHYRFRNSVKKQARKLLSVTNEKLSTPSKDTTDSCTPEEYGAMTMAAFLVTSSMQHGIGLDHVVKLFDRDRKIGILERVFADRFIRNHVFKSKPVKLKSQIFASVEDLSFSDANEEKALVAKETAATQEQQVTSETMSTNQGHQDKEIERTIDWQAKCEECFARVLQLESCVAKQSIQLQELSRLTKLETLVTENITLLTELKESSCHKNVPQHSDNVRLEKEDAVGVIEQHGSERSHKFCKGCDELQQSCEKIDKKVEEGRAALKDLSLDFSSLMACTNATTHRLQQVEQSYRDLHVLVHPENAHTPPSQSPNILKQHPEQQCLEEHTSKPLQQRVERASAENAALQDNGYTLGELTEFQKLGPSSVFYRSAI